MSNLMNPCLNGKNNNIQGVRCLSLSSRDSDDRQSILVKKGGTRGAFQGQIQANEERDFFFFFLFAQIVIGYYYILFLRK